MRAIAPGRVNLIGDHTDYVGGLALPCAIDLAVTAEFSRGGDTVSFTSDATAEPATFPLAPGADDPHASVWQRLVRAALGYAAPREGAHGRLTTTLPIGSGLSSSAACTIALLLALGFEGSPTELVVGAQAVEQSATGVPCGVLDQTAIVFGRRGHATLVDAANLTAEPVPVPDDAAFVIVSSGHARALSDTPYAQRRSEAEAAIGALGGLSTATPTAIEALEDPTLQRRARHIVTENARVRAFAAAMAAGDTAVAGRLMRESHESLRRHAEVSTKDLDKLVDALCSRRGVYGARLTGAGFGGSAVALVNPRDADEVAEMFAGRVVVPSDGARVES